MRIFRHLISCVNFNFNFSNRTHHQRGFVYIELVFVVDVESVISFHRNVFNEFVYFQACHTLFTRITSFCFGLESLIMKAMVLLCSSCFYNMSAYVLHKSKIIFRFALPLWKGVFSAFSKITSFSYSRSCSNWLKHFFFALNLLKTEFKWLCGF